MEVGNGTRSVELEQPLPAADSVGKVNGGHSPWSFLECREVEAAKVESVVLLTAGGPGEVGEELHTSQCVTAAQDVASRLVKACGGGRNRLIKS